MVYLLLICRDAEIIEGNFFLKLISHSVYIQVCLETSYKLSETPFVILTGNTSEYFSDKH